MFLYTVSGVEFYGIRIFNKKSGFHTISEENKDL